MPLDMSYESDSSEEASPQKPQRKNNNRAPSLDDAEAFPETFGAGSAPTQGIPSGVDFASLAGKFTPDETNEFDLTQPRPMQRKTITRISRLREMYYKSRDLCNKPLGTHWSLYVDSGIQGPEKSVECESQLLGNVPTTKAFEPLISPVRQGLSSGSNVRLFKSNGLTSPSMLDEILEKGGKWSVAVSKDLSRDMFEELCLYVLDERLGWAVDGCVYAVRDVVDVLQIWTKASPNPELLAKMTSDINAILGIDEQVPVSFSLHADAFKKASKARKYFIVEPIPGAAYVQSQEVALQPRSKSEVTREKKDKKKIKVKKGEEGFITEGAAIRAQKPKSVNSTEQSKESTDDATTSNPFGNLMVEDEYGHKKKGAKDEEDSPLVFKQRKKPPSRKGSKKSKKDEFDDLPVQPGAVVPLPMFMGAGAVIFLVLAVLLYTYSSSS